MPAEGFAIWYRPGNLDGRPIGKWRPVGYYRSKSDAEEEADRYRRLGSKVVLPQGERPDKLPQRRQ